VIAPCGANPPPRAASDKPDLIAGTIVACKGNKSAGACAVFLDPSQCFAAHSDTKLTVFFFIGFQCSAGSTVVTLLAAITAAAVLCALFGSLQLLGCPSIRVLLGMLLKIGTATTIVAFLMTPATPYSSIPRHVLSFA
tara:strand:- start:147 stop:560 length:414 start_codon:yes stop_codon:yes gene_type:complete